MRFVELAESSGGTVLVNAAGVQFLRHAAAGGTNLYLFGRVEPLHLSDPPEDVARALEDSVPEPPSDPTLALLS